MENTQREFFTINNAWGLQRDSVLKKWNGGYILADEEQFTKLICWLALKKMLYVYVYGEYAKRRKKC
jgi:hypothetical protein